MSDIQVHKTVPVAYRPKYYITDPELHDYYIGVYTTPLPDATEFVTTFTATFTPWADLKVGDIVVKDWTIARARKMLGDRITYTFWKITVKNKKSVWGSACFVDGRHGVPTYGPVARKFVSEGLRTDGLWVIKTA